MDASELHRDMLVFDAHRDVAYEAPLRERFLAGWLVGVDLDLPLLQKGGVHAQVYAFCVAPVPGLPPTAEVLRELDLALASIEAHSDQVVLATTAARVREARAQGRIAVLLSLEGAEPLLSELGLLRVFYRLGFRAIGLTWNFRNALADGAREGSEGGGLSRSGRAMVQEMNRLGMVIDIAHLNGAGMRDVLALSERPVIHSHGTCASLLQRPKRATNDQLLEVIAAKGGLFCVTTVPEALVTDGREATLEDYLDHIEHAVKVMGAEHVGLGADFDVYQSRLGPSAMHWVKGLEEVDRWPEVTAGLLRRGFGEADIRKIMGENLLRVYAEIIG